MILTKIEAVSARGEVMALPLGSVSSGYLVKGIEGLDPVDASIISSEFSGLDGTQYQASSRENRNIVLTLGYEEGFSSFSVQQLRRRLYGFFMPKTQVTLRFYLDDVFFASTNGRVETAKAPLNTQEPEMVVSVICFDPDFIAPSSVALSGSTVADATEQVYTYDGTVETGVIFRMTMNRALSSFIIYNNPLINDAAQIFEFASPLILGDTVEISMIPGSKYARLTRNSTASSILYGVSPAASWIKMFPGENHIRVYAEGAAIPYTIEYTPRYGGL